MRRSDEPIYWGLFGAGWHGGCHAAAGDCPDYRSAGAHGHHGRGDHELRARARIRQLLVGACILLAIIALPIWHGMHRIYHGLHDLGIHTTKLHHYVFYGFAFLVSAITVGLLMVLVFQ